MTKNSAPVKVVFVSAEFAPLVKVGGLGEAAAGLVGELVRLGVDVEAVVPDYGNHEYHPIGPVDVLDVPDWVGSATAQRVALADGALVTLVRTPGMARPHPYDDPGTDHSWSDNDRRFFGFNAAAAAIVDDRRPDVLHVNDWHTSLVPALTEHRVPNILTIHNVAYQGTADSGWAAALRRDHDAYLDRGVLNPLCGASRRADRVIAVSPGYAREIRHEPAGAGLSEVLSARGDAFTGIRNGIAADLWDPTRNPLLPVRYDHDDLSGKDICRKQLLSRTTLTDDGAPLIGVVARLVDQKGVDMLLDLAAFLPQVPARLVVVGDGETSLVAQAARIAGAAPDHVHFFGRYSDEVGALVVAGADLLAVPSRFEPCGLVQMQAMTCGTIPVVTSVGGLADTVIDADRDPRRGNGFVAEQADHVHLLDAIHRAARGVQDAGRRSAIQRRGMTDDWSWRIPAARYAEEYNGLPEGMT